MRLLLFALTLLTGLAAGAGLGLAIMIHVMNFHFEPRAAQTGGMGSREVSTDSSETTISPLSAPPKRDLVLLIVKLDQLSSKPSALQLTADQSKELQNTLLAMANSADGGDPKLLLNPLHTLLAQNKAALVAAGYAWPGAADVFSADEYRKHLQSLQERLKK